jgi:transcriptional regulator with XRE-family HTH domain
MPHPTSGVLNPGGLGLPAKNNSMEEPGQKLRKRREELGLRVRDVEEASIQIAERRKNSEYIVIISRLSEIENRGTIPSIYRLYSLCSIYRLDLMEVLEWFGVDVSMMPADAACVEVSRTHMIGFKGNNGHGEVQLPLALDPGIDLKRTTFLSRMIQRWGRMPAMLLNGLDLKSHRYAYIGTEDWAMYPLIQPGSLVLIDETRHKILPGGWTNEFDRPIYFLEHRQGYVCGWCNLNEHQLVLQPHPASQCNPEVFGFPDEIDVIGQVTGVAMRLDQGKRRRTRS